MLDRTLIRFFFPNARDLLKGRAEPNCVPTEQMRLLYRFAVHPAALEILPEELTRTWPATYNNAQWRAQRAPLRATATQGATGNRLQPTGLDFHSRYLNGWVELIKAKVNANEQLAWARGMFFGVELKGVKNRDGSLHPPPERDLVDEGECTFIPRHPLTETHYSSHAQMGISLTQRILRQAPSRDCLPISTPHNFPQAAGSWTLPPL
jgi:hypothetical protein